MNKSNINFAKPSQKQLNSLLEYYQTRRYIDAEKLSLSITHEFPEHQFAWKVLGAVLKLNGKRDESLIANQKSAQLEPQDSEAHNNLGIILKELGRLNEAEASYKKAIIVKPDFAEAHNNLGNTLKELGKFDEAEASYRKAITLKTDYAEAHNNLGNTLNELNRLDEAEASYRKAIILKPDYVEACYNLGNTLKELEKLDEAAVSYSKAITLKPDFAKAYNNLGDTLKELGKFDEAEASFEKAIKLKSDYELAHNNLGIILYKLNKLDEAETCFKKAIELKPDYSEAHNNLGNILHKQEKLEEAEASYNKTIKLKPDYFEAHINLSNVLSDKGDLVEAIDSCKHAINIQPDFAEAWNNIFFLLQAIKSKNLSIEDRLPLLGEQIHSKYSQILKSILSYRLNLGSPSSESFLNEVISILSSDDDILIKNPKVPYSQLITGPTPQKKITALIHFGRSGTGLLHSLIDGHPEVSTLPSIYFSQFFDQSMWKKIIVGGWEEIADRFAAIYAVLFDASSTTPVATKGYETIYNIGRKEGMVNIGTESNEVVSVDKKVFIKELKQLMNYHDQLDALTFFKLVHSAYEVALKNLNEKNHIFYHIHNPDVYAQLNFLSLAHNTKWLMMVREPLQSCESWVMKSFPGNDYKKISNKIFQMLFEVDQPIFRSDNSIGVKLEDLKEYPKKTILALCNWLGIKERDSLYHMTAQGKKWWGDPVSPDYKKDGMNPFGKISINRKSGSVFSKNDQFILHTLFYPISVQFGYKKENLKQFKNDLKIIRPMLDQMFDFEKKIVQNKNMNTENFMKSGTYLYLRSGMIERWNTLNKFHTYPNMLTPLKIN